MIIYNVFDYAVVVGLSLAAAGAFGYLVALLVAISESGGR